MDKDREKGSVFLPKYDAHGLICAIVSDVADNEILMVGYMNAQAVTMTCESGIAHFWSRSRQKLWKKGETSGNILKVEQILVDCDQDALLVKARPAGPTCHTGVRSCFYRELNDGGLKFI